MISVAVVICALAVSTVNEYRQYKAKNFLTHISKNMFLGESRIVQRYGTLVNNAVSIYNNKSTEDYINSFEYSKEMTFHSGLIEKIKAAGFTKGHYVKRRS